IGSIAPAGVALHVNEPVDIVLITLPLRFLAELDQEVVADLENALEFVAVATLHENRRAYSAHPLPGNVRRDPGADLLGLPHYHALDTAYPALRNCSWVQLRFCVNSRITAMPPPPFPDANNTMGYCPWPAG